MSEWVTPEKLDASTLWNSGLELLSMNASEHQLSQLKKYVELLNRWNKTYNLTAVRDPVEMISVHIFDSLSIAGILRGTNCLDVGSGAGLPTIPLAIMQPRRLFTALDTNGKKTRFIQQAVIELGLKNVQVEQTRVEQWKSSQTFDAIVSRAFASIRDFVESSAQHLSKKGCLYAMKGQFPAEELANLPDDFKLIKTHELNVPYILGKRHLLEIGYET